MNTSNPFFFLIDVAFDIYTMLLLLRFLFQTVGADFYNPISQFVVKVTQPVIGPVHGIVKAFGSKKPPKKGNGQVHHIHPQPRGSGPINAGHIAVLLAAVFIVLKLLVASALTGVSYPVSTIIVTSIHDLISLTIDVFIFSVFILAILSWINPDPSNPIVTILRSLTAPVLRPVQRIVKPISGIDLSPIVALIGLMFLKRLVTYLFQML